MIQLKLTTKKWNVLAIGNTSGDHGSDHIVESKNVCLFKEPNHSQKYPMALPTKLTALCVSMFRGSEKGRQTYTT